MAQQELGVGPALALLADAIVLGHAHVLEKHLVDVVPAVERDDGAHRNAGRFHVDEQEGNALLRLHLRVGAHQHEHHVGPVTLTGPGLLAVDQVMIAIVLGPAAQGCQVRARARFGIALAPEVVGRKNARQVAGFLFIRAEGVDHRPHHAQPEGHHRGRPGIGRGALEDIALRRRPAGAAVFLGPGRGDPALVEKNALPAVEVFFLQVAAALYLGAQFGRQLALEEIPHLALEGQVLVAELKIHGA